MGDNIVARIPHPTIAPIPLSTTEELTVAYRQFCTTARAPILLHNCVIPFPDRGLHLEISAPVGEVAERVVKRIEIAQQERECNRLSPNTGAVNQIYQQQASRRSLAISKSFLGKRSRKESTFGWEVGEDSSHERWARHQESGISATAGEASYERSISAAIRLPIAALLSRVMCALDPSAAGEWHGCSPRFLAQWPSPGAVDEAKRFYMGQSKRHRLNVRNFHRRSDLLRRHLTLHDGSAPSDSKRVRACDACHASKIRCDGGVRCSLCTKRGIDCAFTRGPALGSAANLQQGSASSLHSAHGSRSPDPPGSGTEASASAGGSQPDTTQAIPANYMDPLGQAAQQQDPVSIPIEGLKLVLEAVSKPRSPEPSSRPQRQPPPQVKEWSSACIKAYMGRFHDRWPIVHAPTFEREVDSVRLRSTAIIIGSWLQNETDNSLIFDIHSILVKRLLDELTDTTVDSNAIWPLRTLQSSMLNIIFAFESGREQHMKKARLLFSLLVTVFRQLRVFSAEAVDHQIRIHFSGDFPPWVFSMKEKWKRLATNIFKLDTYISLLTQQPPSLQREEMGLGLTSTFALWNAYGLDVFFRRWPSEPLERSQYKIRDLALGSQQPISPIILVEDIQIRMMGVTNYVWILSKMRGNPNPALCISPDQKELISARLKRCKLQLDGMTSIWKEPDQHKMHIEFLLRAYSAGEEPFHEDWEKPVQSRFFSFIFSATMLYHLLNMHIYADVHSYMQNLPVVSSPGVTPSSLSATPPINNAEIHDWATSMDSRIAVSHAIFAYRVYGSTTSSPSDLKAEVVDPIAHMTIAAGAAVLWTWIQNNSAACSCMSMPLAGELDFGFVPLGAGKSPEVDHWIRNGGNIWLHGVHVCKCNVDVWLSPFAAILSHGAKKWEVGDVFAQMLWSRLGLQRGV
ncbi:transcription factor zn, c2h2 / cys6 [Trichoderma arundinaceum]|uniref:Transcription factor zn, c2h2 / cys6 n=1 Tax=Trichoderma arundinaceum TaxID=490622 RepID=A0A395P113_TRIAR|nr:transcription factor zn, c2h2 / cys6 [Trichoderma arundinaceum]